ncbi:hypothetical protein HZA96_01010 [Candidatus Woesearchaeota archaeon]|nr:hypothetical protein [Candidatus Woesearchaeota archaeon]
MIQKYQQSTFETCLAVDLLNLVGIEISQKIEREVIDYVLDFSRDNFTIGHLDFIAKRYDAKLNLYVDNKPFFNFIKKFKFSGNINLFNQKIDLKLIDERIKFSPIIVYVDSYNLWKVRNHLKFCPQLIQKR